MEREAHRRRRRYPALNREIEETVISVLHDAGLDVRPGGGTFVKDAYFDADESDCERDLVSLDLTQLRQSQESVVVKHLADSLSPVEWKPSTSDNFQRPC